MFTIRFALAILVITGLTCCNKEVETKNAISVTIHGYNISDIPLKVTVDTVVFDKQILASNAQINFSMVYPYFPTQKEATLHVTNPEGKDLLQQTLTLADKQLEFFFPLVNINGKLLEVNPPLPNDTTNKLGFYIYYTESNDPIDIILYNPNSGQTVYLAQNVVPLTWVYTDYLPADGLKDKNEIGSSTVYFFKAGTFDQFAFNNDEYLSQVTAFGLYLPHSAYNLNKVQSYFITPSANGSQLDIVRLFPNSKEY